LTAMVALVGVSLLLDGFGLGVAADTGQWWLTRPLWLAALVGATVPFILILGRYERPGPDVRPAPQVWQPVAAMIAACTGLGILAAVGVSDADGLNGIALSLPFLAVTLGGIGGARRWARRRSGLPWWDKCLPGPKW
ncbi:MAG: hypothetical protein ACRDX9_14920, partial [Acidimicrobiia bacterium]